MSGIGAVHGRVLPGQQVTECWLPLGGVALGQVAPLAEGDS